MEMVVILVLLVSQQLVFRGLLPWNLQVESGLHLVADQNKVRCKIVVRLPIRSLFETVRTFPLCVLVPLPALG